MERILIIEDDNDIASIERDFLLVNGFEVDISLDGFEGLKKGLSGNYDLILLDIMLPGITGFDICRKLRESIDIPILMVTAKLDDVDKIRGLGLGADDYIEKPFSPSVLVARVKSNLAQYKRLKSKGETKERLIECGAIVVNPLTHRVFVHDKEVDLKNKEYELLLFLMNNVDIVFSKDRLYENIWGYDALGDNATVAVHINRLREKIEDDPSNPHYIQTVWGAGYRFRA
ncbi:MAG: response regulator transcription factor [Faecalibacterium sp.]|nr:response regulator transcription factor [Ruminococcus sp.]MCM1393106.1 response regulator transcription factor [Ruminococcus sp.]MCM1485216.1 response regulator transcription factor [Faecalibacterium sp.]